MNIKRYELLEHTADIRLRAFGADLQELFTNAALGMAAYLFGEQVFNFKADAFERIEVSAASSDVLLADWLSAILYKTLTSYRAFVEFQFDELDNSSLKGTAGSVKAQAVEDIKAVTYHDLAVTRGDHGYEATITFDI